MWQSLIKCLLAAGRSQADVAREIGVDQSTVSRIFSGRQSDIGGNAGLKLIALAGGQIHLPPAVPCAQGDAREAA